MTRRWLALALLVALALASFLQPMARAQTAAPLVQVTGDPADDSYPSLTRLADGRLWAVWFSFRSAGYGLWSSMSSDNGATWSTPVLLINDFAWSPAAMQSADGALWIVWASYRSGNWDIWFKTSTDGGSTWSADRQLTTSLGDDQMPAIAQAADGRIVVVWSAYYDLWSAFSTDGGATWVTYRRITNDYQYDAQPTLARAADGTLWLVWRSYAIPQSLAFSKSTDNGVTWTAPAPLPFTPPGDSWDSPSLALASDGKLWLAWSGVLGDLNVWYSTSSDGGATWSTATRFTAFVGRDDDPSLARLPNGAMGLAWVSDRSGNGDIWFGIPGQREDLNPPPYVYWQGIEPSPNPQEGDTITFRASVGDEKGLDHVDLVWSLAASGDQPELRMYDDGAHGDGAAGDGIYGVQVDPLPAGTQGSYRVRATDVDGNTFIRPYATPFQVLPRFVKTGDLLLVPDSAGGDTASFQRYFTDALDTLGYHYDVWDTYLRGAPSSTVLNQYTSGAILWAAPGYGYLNDYNVLGALAAYLDAGGRLFVTGQDVAYYLANVNPAFLHDYLHATYVQNDCGLYALAGVASDPIGDGLALNISGGDGANNQWSKDEVNPVAPAVPVLTYVQGSTTPLAAPAVPAPSATQMGAQAAPTLDTRDFPTVTSVAGSGTAGLRVDTGTYKVVYFAFGFEAINSEQTRLLTMSRVLNWLGVAPAEQGRDLTVRASLVSGDPEPGGSLTFRLAYANRGNLAASNARVTATLPQGLSYLSASVPPSSVAGQELAWDLGTLPSCVEAGASGEITVTARVAETVPGNAWLELQAQITTADSETDLAGLGLKGEYYQYDVDAIGSPPGDPFTNGTLLLRQVDPTIDFDWSMGSPQPLVPCDHFAARWSGYVYAPHDGQYTFWLATDDGSRLWVNGTSLVDNWAVHGMQAVTGTITLAGGQWYPIRLDYFEGEGAAGARLQWQQPGATSATTTPQRYLSPEAGAANDRSAVGVRIRPRLKTSDLLLVLDYGGYDTDGFRPYFTRALDALGYTYDVWDTEAQGAPESWVLDQYVSGTVIWAAPWWGHIVYPPTIAVLQSFLDQGGRLFLTSQDAGYYLNAWGNTGFLHGYLHANWVQDFTGLNGVTGKAGDPIGDSLTLGLFGGDAWISQSDADELDPLAPAAQVFTYSALTASPAQAGDESASTSTTPTAAAPTPAPGVQPAPQEATALTAAAASSSGTAGLRVDTGTYKVVYFAFGFEGINSAASRAVVMERVLAWLKGVPPRLILLSPDDGQPVAPGGVTFTWSSVPGATAYEFQADTAPTFDSPALVDATVTATSYTRSFTAPGTYYWRVRPLPAGAYSAPRRFSLAGPLVQVTSGAEDDYLPSLIRSADGRLWVAWGSYGSSNNIWYKTSSDGGATWSPAAPLTTDGMSFDPAMTQTADGRLWVVWYSSRSGDSDIWYRTSSDGGSTWSAEVQLTNHDDSHIDTGPAIYQTADGRIWVVWASYRAGAYGLWYKTSSDGGATWSADTLLVTDVAASNPGIAQAGDGRLWVVWHSYNPATSTWCISYTTSSDGGASWAPVAALSPSELDQYRPAIARGTDGTLWVGWYTQDATDTDLWLTYSTDQGVTWSAPTRFTRFLGNDWGPSLAAGSNGRLLVAWVSDRSGNRDIWFGIPGEREDVNPPPYVVWMSNQPSPNPVEGDPITFLAYVRDEKGVANVELEWSLNGTLQANLQMFDDGAHGDWSPGDGTYGAQLAPLAVGSHVLYRARATDSDGNTYVPTEWSRMQVLPRFVQTSNLLFVLDSRDANEAARIQPYYKSALDALGYRFDVWDASLRGAPPADTLKRYASGAVVWDTPSWGYISSSYTSEQLRAFLDAGGRLFITGQNVAYNLAIVNPTFLRNYLHAAFVQSDSGLYAVAGVAGDPIGDGLALNISGGDGANNQWSKNEVNPVAPAVPVLTYVQGSTTPLAAPAMPARSVPEVEVLGVPAVDGRAFSSVTSVVGSGTAGLRVDTGTYKVVYFAFGFEGINSAAARVAVMDRVLTWLGMPRTVGQLSTGWNLVSLPVAPSSTVVTDVLSSLAGKYDAVFAYDAADAADPWKQYSPGASGNDLATVNERMGLWIHATDAVTLTVTGTVSVSPTISLKAGWNLVGYPSAATRSVAEALASIGGKYDLVYAYDPANIGDPWKKFNPAMPAVLNDLREMAPGKGYWVHVTEDCIWRLP